MRAALLLLLALSALAGCFGPPEVPDDATTATHGGLTLGTWTQMRGERLELHGVLQNSGPSVEIRTGCGHPWISDISGPAGSVAYVERPPEIACPTYWDELRSGDFLTFFHSWDFQNHNRETGEAWTAPGGPHTWTLSVQLRDDSIPLTAAVPIPVPCSDRNPCGLAGISIASSLEAHDAGWTMRANATNAGPHTYKISAICSPNWTEAMSRDGKAVEHREPAFQCEADGVRDWVPGESLTFEATWDGTLWDDGYTPARAGDYIWVASVHTLEPSMSLGTTQTVTVQ